MGTILYQTQHEVDSVIRSVSLSLNKTEQKYPMHKHEFLALKWAVIDQFQEYLYDNQFSVYTDKNPMTYVLMTAKLDTMGHYWVTGLPN